MSKLEHTPGPWKVLPHVFSRDYIRVRGTRLGSRYKIANVHMPYLDTFYLIQDDANEESIANARLIAAAPELLEALKGLLADITEYMVINNLGGHNNHSHVWARASIAKAEGRDQ